jgi:hypothetical protein
MRKYQNCGAPCTASVLSHQNAAIEKRKEKHRNYVLIIQQKVDKVQSRERKGSTSCGSCKAAQYSNYSAFEYSRKQVKAPFTVIRCYYEEKRKKAGV